MERRRYLERHPFLTLPAALVLLAGTTLAQGNQGSIRGTISDATGAALADAEVIVTSEATGVAKTLTTNASGFYSADALIPGDYSVRVSKEGFSQTTVQHVALDPGQTRESSLSLKVGSTNQQVEVTADQLAVETQDSGSGGTITSKQVENLMLNGRNFQSMGQLIPGVSSTAGNNQQSAVTVGGGFINNAAGVPVTSTGTSANLSTGLVFAGQNGTPHGFFTAKKTNVAPRIGFAYDLTGDGKTSLRAGYGIGYSRLAVEAIYNAFGQNPPYTQSSNITSGTLENPTSGLATGLSPQTLNAVGPTFTPSQLQSYSLSVERQLFPSAVLSIAYAGTQFRHQDTFGYDQNQPLPVSAPSQFTATTNCIAYQPIVSHYDFDPCINTNATSPNFTRPYKGYSNIYTEAGIGSGNYNALQAGFVYRKDSVNATVAYAYGKSLSQFGHSSNGGGGGSIAGGGGQGIQDWRNLAVEYGPSNFDRTHVLTFSGVYDIQAFRQGGNVLERQVLGGWSLATLSVLESGFAFTPGISTGVNGLAIRPNQVAPIHLIKNKTQWFNADPTVPGHAFEAPANGFYGNARPGTIRGPREISFNIAGYKTFPIYERLNLQFRAEAFNFLNHPNFGNVDTTVGDTQNYGKITSALDPRILEFSARVNF